MRNAKTIRLSLLLLGCAQLAYGQTAQEVVDIPTRPGVTQRMIVLTPPAPKAAVILFAGSHGGLQISKEGSFNGGEGNFLVRSRQLFADQGLITVVVDAPSDRTGPSFLSGFRQSPEHAADIKAVIARVRSQSPVPVWLVGTSRGTQSAASIAIRLNGPEGPDGLVLTSTILTEEKGEGRPVPDMALEKLNIPVLVVHHEQDGCKNCSFSAIPTLMAKLDRVPRKQLLSFKGGESRGNPCEAWAHHGYNGQEREVVGKIAAWILAK